jgi:hypothetical protein
LVSNVSTRNILGLGRLRVSGLRKSGDRIPSRTRHARSHEFGARCRLTMRSKGGGVPQSTYSSVSAPVRRQRSTIWATRLSETRLTDCPAGSNSLNSWLVTFVHPIGGQVHAAQCRPGQPVAAFVFRMTVVAADPLESDCMPIAEAQQVVPEIDILGRTFVAFDPASGFPPSRPAFCNAVYNILRVAEQSYVARFFQRQQALNRRRQFHPVVCRNAVSTGKFLPVLAI